MPRPLDSVKAHAGARHVVRITAYDETDDTGAPLMYAIQWMNGLKPQAVIFPFQSGDPNRHTNGLTEQSLLAVLIDRIAERTDIDTKPVLHHLRHALASMNEALAADVTGHYGNLKLVEPSEGGPAG